MIDDDEVTDLILATQILQEMHVTPYVSMSKAQYFSHPLYANQHWMLINEYKKSHTKEPI